MTITFQLQIDNKFYNSFPYVQTKLTEEFDSDQLDTMLAHLKMFVYKLNEFGYVQADMYVDQNRYEGSD